MRFKNAYNLEHEVQDCVNQANSNRLRRWGLVDSCITFSRNPQPVRLSVISFEKSFFVKRSRLWCRQQYRKNTDRNWAGDIIYLCLSEKFQGKRPKNTDQKWAGDIIYLCLNEEFRGKQRKNTDKNCRSVYRYLYFGKNAWNEACNLEHEVQDCINQAN